MLQSNGPFCRGALRECDGPKQDHRDSPGDDRTSHVPDHVRCLARPKGRDQLDRLDGHAAPKSRYDDGKSSSHGEYPEKGSRSEKKRI